MKYRRVYVNGGTYFFTLVTYNRQPIFSNDRTIELLSDAFRKTSERLPFQIVAHVIAPDHLHFICTLPEETSDFSTRWRLIKSHFTRNCKVNRDLDRSISRINKGEQTIWQRRFWEHLIRDEYDLTRHIEYIHYNPVKHGYVTSPREWIHSSFLNFVRDGLYPVNWGENWDEWSGEPGME